MNPVIANTLLGTGVIGAVLLLMLTGWLFTRSHVEDLRKQIARAEETAANERKARELAESAARTALEQGRTLVQLMESVKKAGEKS